MLEGNDKRRDQDNLPPLCCRPLCVRFMSCWNAWNDAGMKSLRCRDETEENQTLGDNA